MNQHVGAVLAEVAEKVKGSNTQVRERVVSALVEKEVASRAKLLDDSLAKLVELERGLKKMKPDIETVSAEGAVQTAWSKKAFDEHKKAKERFEALEKAVEAALDGDKEQWAKLREQLQKAGNAGGDKGGASE